MARALPARRRAAVPPAGRRARRRATTESGDAPPEGTATTVVSNFSTSLDGFIADPQGEVGPLFDWYFNGDVEVRPPGYPITFRMSEASARYWSEYTRPGAWGAAICGRGIFDHTRGWGGNPPLGLPTFVLTHRPPPADWPPRPDAPFTFVTDGIHSALEQARAVAGVSMIGVSGANVAQQYLNAGLLDEVRIDLVPVLLRRGIRYFDAIENTAARFERLRVVEGVGVTHLRYRVTYDGQ